MSFEIGKIFNIAKTGVNEKGEIQVSKTNPSAAYQLCIEDIVTGRTFIASKTRFGKSHTARKIVESCYGHVGIIIIDPEGEYASLREKYGFLIIGKDIPLNKETAEFMAEEILHTKTSAIIDLSMVEDEEEGKEYVNLFLKKFFHLQTTLRIPYLLLVEEAEDFIPERGVATETCLRILFNVVKRGGKRGIAAIFVAHRPASVSKAVLSQLSNKIIGNVESTDFEALKKVARVSDKVVELLPSLAKGEFFFTGAWIAESDFVKVGSVETTHLGYTPKVVPLPPSDLQAVITKLEKALPEFINKVKPTVGSVEAAKAEITKQLEGKYKERVTAILKNADEKAERKYKVQMDELKENLNTLSRDATLQTPQPIDSVFDHPIVRTRMTELTDRARDLLKKIDQEPGLTRQQLAAFLTSSTDAVGGLVEKVNDTFKAKVLVGEGKPMRYKSQLVYFFGGGNKKEVEELTKLTNKINELQRSIGEEKASKAALQEEIKELKTKKTRLTELEDLTGKQASRIQSLEATLETASEEKQKLLAKIKPAEAIIELISAVVKEQVTTLPQAAGTALSEQDIAKILEAAAGTLLEKFAKIAEDKAKEALATLTPQAETSPPGTALSLEQKVTHFDLKKTEEHIQVDTETLPGQIVYLITKGFFDTRQNRMNIMTELSNNGWTPNNKEVDGAMLDLVKKGIFYRKISTGNTFWYSLQSEAKNLIHN